MWTTAIIFILTSWIVIVNGQTGVDLTEAEIKFVLNYTNLLRRTVQTTAMKVLKYSSRLASAAKQAAMKCSYDDTQSGVNYFPMSRPPGNRRPQLIVVIQSWWQERRIYSYDRRICDHGRTCRHYLQLAYNNTGEIGCAMAECADIKNTRLPIGGYLIACRYNPAGPANGAPPYIMPSMQSPTCSKCDGFGDDYLCSNYHMCEEMELLSNGQDQTNPDSDNGSGNLNGDENENGDTNGTLSNNNDDLDGDQK